MKTEDRAADRHVLDHAARTCTASLDALRQQHAPSPPDMAPSTGTPERRIDPVAQWPASLAPDLLECIAAEIVILRFSQELLEDHVNAVRAAQSPDTGPTNSLRSVGDGLCDVLDAILGVEIRLRALTIRPSLRVNTPHPAGAHDAALSIDTALSALNHPIHLLRVFRNETLEARDPPMPQHHLASDDRHALTNILEDVIAALKQTASALHPLAAVATCRF